MVEMTLWCRVVEAQKVGHARSACARDSRLKFGKQSSRETYRLNYSSQTPCTTTSQRQRYSVSGLQWLFVSVIVRTLLLGQLALQLCHYLPGRCRPFGVSHPHLASGLRARPCGTAAVSLCISHYSNAIAFMPCARPCGTAAVRLMCLLPFSDLDSPEPPMLSLTKTQNARNHSKNHARKK